MSRLPPTDVNALTPEQRRVYDSIASGPRGGFRGPFPALIHSPQVAQLVADTGAHLRYGTSLPARLSELAIVITGLFWKAAPEWAGHVPLARKAGIGEDIIQALAAGRRPTFDKVDEELVYAFTMEVLEQRKVSEPTYKRLVEHFGLPTLVDLCGVVGYYCMVGVALKTFLLPPSTDEPLPFEY